MTKLCTRIFIRMECQEHGYPFSEAIFATDLEFPHFVEGTQEYDVVTSGIAELSQ